jgi:BolA protein
MKRRENMTIELLIEQKLLEAFSPLHLDITRNSFDFDLSGVEQSNIKVVIISSLFEGQRIHQRHKAINKVLAQELIEEISVLALHTYTEKEWLYSFSTLPLFLRYEPNEQHIA